MKLCLLIIVNAYAAKSLSWDGNSVDPNCPRFVKAELGLQGFGDQINHYYYYLHMAQLLSATLIVEGFESGFHVGQRYYHMISQFLGLKKDLNISSVNQIYNSTGNLKVIYLSFPELRSIIQRGELSKFPCNVVLRSNIGDCKTQMRRGKENVQASVLWCLTSQVMNNQSCLENNSECTFYDFIEPLLPVLRKYANPRLKCRQMGIGFDNKSDAKNVEDRINVAWHVRQGDICLHCKDQGYYTRMYKLVQQTAKYLTSKTNPNINIVVDIEFAKLKSAIHIPGAKIMGQKPMLETLCRFYTSDIFVTSGSSLSDAVLFAEPFYPVVIEERRKAADLYPHELHRYYMFDPKTNVLVNNAVPLLPVDELQQRFYEIKENTLSI